MARVDGPMKGTNPVTSTGNSYANLGEKRPLDPESGASTSTGYKKPRLQQRTDYTRWRMLDEKGRHTWHYLDDDEDAKEWPQTTADKYFLGLPTVGLNINDDSALEYSYLLAISRTFPIFHLPKPRLRP